MNHIPPSTKETLFSFCEFDDGANLCHRPIKDRKDTKSICLLLDPGYTLPKYSQAEKHELSKAEYEFVNNNTRILMNEANEIREKNARAKREKRRAAARPRPPSRHNGRKEWQNKLYNNRHGGSKINKKYKTLKKSKSHKSKSHKSKSSRKTKTRKN